MSVDSVNTNLLQNVFGPQCHQSNNIKEVSPQKTEASQFTCENTEEPQPEPSDSVEKAATPHLGNNADVRA